MLEAEYDAQRNIAPFLENRVLRRIVQVGLWQLCHWCGAVWRRAQLVSAAGEQMLRCITHKRSPAQPRPAPRPSAPLPLQTFTNDPSGDFGKWAQNPRVIEMLREAKRLMDEG